jgi:hypothetical protein
MKRAALSLWAVLVGWAIGLPGCEHTRNVRPASADLDTEPEEGASHESAPTKGFFKPTRLPGALSDEGAEIERSLGVR